MTPAGRAGWQCCEPRSCEPAHFTVVGAEGQQRNLPAFCLTQIACFVIALWREKSQLKSDPMGFLLVPRQLLWFSHHYRSEYRHVPFLVCSHSSPAYPAALVCDNTSLCPLVFLRCRQDFLAAAAAAGEVCDASLRWLVAFFLAVNSHGLHHYVISLRLTRASSSPVYICIFTKVPLSELNTQILNLEFECVYCAA